MSDCFPAKRLNHTTTLESLNAGFIVRHQINAAVFSQIISIVTQYSVLLIGLLQGEGVEVVAQVSFPEAVDPDQTSAFLNGDLLELSITKLSVNGVPA